MQSLHSSSVGILLGLILVSGWGVLCLLYQIIKQQGRLLRRLDEIEQHLGLTRTPRVPVGLAMGAQFPAFKLPDLEGKEVALEDFRGKRVLLVNWSPRCDFCVRIAPDLAKLQQALQAHNVELALASYGDAGTNRELAGEHGLKGLLLLQKDAGGIEAFQGLGTPVAYLLDEEGRVAKALAVGADHVAVLARYAVGDATEAELGRGASGKQGTCGQTAGKKKKPQKIKSVGPGTELKKLLEKMGIAVTPDCPCNGHAALMDRNGCEWCEQNLDIIVGWMREETARRGLVFIEKGAKLLVKRAIDTARRIEGETNNQSGNIIGARERASV